MHLLLDVLTLCNISRFHLSVVHQNSLYLPKMAGVQISIMKLWRGEYELMGEIFAPLITFANGSHHFAGPFRTIVSIYEANESREACWKAVWSFNYRHQSDLRSDLTTEARFVLRGNTITYRNAVIIRDVVMPEHMLAHLILYNFYLLLLRVLN